MYIDAKTHIAMQLDSWELVDYFTDEQIYQICQDIGVCKQTDTADVWAKRIGEYLPEFLLSECDSMSEATMDEIRPSRLPKGCTKAMYDEIFEDGFNWACAHIRDNAQRFVEWVKG